MMKLEYIGHASFIVKINGVNRILIDPWFHSAFLGSWFPYPDNRHLENYVLNQDFEYLYISHTHEDHFDVEFLKKFKRKIKILCPDYRSGALKRKFNELGYDDFIMIGHRETYKADDFSATV